MMLIRIIIDNDCDVQDNYNDDYGDEDALDLMKKILLNQSIHMTT